MNIVPETCLTCGAECMERVISKRYVSSGIESATYKCGLRYESYINHGFRAAFDIKEACPKSPAEQTKAIRRQEIDESVAKALNQVKASYEECESFCRRMGRDKGSLDDGVWAILTVKQKHK